MVKMNKRKITFVIALIMIFAAPVIGITAAKIDSSRFSPETYKGTYVLNKSGENSGVKRYLCVEIRNEKSGSEKGESDKKAENMPEKISFEGEIYDSAGKTESVFTGRLLSDKKAVFFESKDGKYGYVLRVKGQHYLYKDINGSTVSVEKVSEVPVKAMKE